MNKFLFFLLAALICLPFSNAHGFSKMGEDCSKCHKLTKEEATAIVKNMSPAWSIIDIKSSPVKSMWEIDIATGQQNVPAYLDFSKRYILMGELIDLKEKKNLSRERFEDLNRVDVSTIPLDDAIVMGDKNAPHKLIVFSDPDCPFCGKLHEEIKKVLEKRKDIAFFIKMFPLPMHKGAYDKAKTIVCEKSLALLDDAFARKDIPPAKCTTSVIDDNIKLGGKLGINGTPAVIFPDGKIQPGYMEADALIQAVLKK